jgi:replicative superfamily II helicase
VQKQSQKRAIVDSAIKQRKIDLVTATEMISAGFADAKLCDEKIIKCWEEYGDKSQRNVADISHKAELSNCIKNAAPICMKQFNTCQ